MVKFAYTISYVADVNAALTFFENAFGMRRRFITPEKDYGEMETGETVLAFAAHKLGETNLTDGYIRADQSDKPLGMEIVLTADDVDATHKNAIKHGAIELQAPQVKPWGQTVSYVRCPSGLLLELCTVVGG